MLTFVLALAAAPSRAQAVTGCTPQTLIDTGKIASQVILVGEAHGSNEMPAFTLGLVCSLLTSGKSVVLGLEYAGEQQARFDRYIVSDGSADAQQMMQGYDWRGGCQDGRGSKAMLGLIESMRGLRAAGARVGLLALRQNEKLDVPMTEQESGRISAADNVLTSRISDRSMADYIVRTAILHRGYVFVILVGAGHASTVQGYSRDPEFRPMGNVLRSLMPDTTIIGFDTRGGSRWSAGRGGCVVHGEEPGPL
ncbi:hypothetical protein BH09PSE6_BH09PSE6_08150 [soil metagenome]